MLKRFPFAPLYFCDISHPDILAYNITEISQSIALRSEMTSLAAA